MELIKQYGTPLKITYLPKISQQINRAKRMFNVAMAKVDYKGSYNYCYHRQPLLVRAGEAMKNDIHLETSSAYDIHIINALYDSGIIDKDRHHLQRFQAAAVCGEHRPAGQRSFVNIPVLDNKEGWSCSRIRSPRNAGRHPHRREENQVRFYTSRLGIRYNDIINYKAKLKNNKSSAQDAALLPQYRHQDGLLLERVVEVHQRLLRAEGHLPRIGQPQHRRRIPIRTRSTSVRLQYLTEEIIAQIKNICHRNDTEEPNIFTEFGSFTVGESGAALYSIVNQKQQNDRENWYMIDSSFITTLPDTWGINQRYIMLAVNNWDREYQRVLLGGLTCDSEDFYNAESHTNAIFLPKLEPGNTQYIGFFHTGAYQESLGGFGGIQHCLIPAPKHII
ncbi:MAG: arginine decarboxylase, partial [Alistipes finegoldii]